MTRKSASQQLTEEAAASDDDQTFSVFLSHCLADAELIWGVKQLLEEQGETVYVDWIVDRQLDRANVTSKTADTLRQRMRQSQSMIFATSTSSPDSKWMPWELGYFDGLRQGQVAVLPLIQSDGGGFTGQEYLGLYPLVERLLTQSGDERIYVTLGAGSRVYAEMKDFRSGKQPYKAY